MLKRLKKVYKNCVLFYAHYDSFKIMFIGNSDECLDYLMKNKQKIYNASSYWDGYDELSSKNYKSFQEYEDALNKYQEENSALYDSSFEAGMEYYHIFTQKDDIILDVTDELTS